MHYFVQEIFGDYPLEFNHDDLCLMKGKCYEDETNTCWVSFSVFFELATIVVKENGLYEAYTPEDALR